MLFSEYVAAAAVRAAAVFTGQGYVARIKMSWRNNHVIYVVTCEQI
jgi:hypothetical protein